MILNKINIPFDFYQLFELINDLERPFFLDSGRGYEKKLGRYSFMGADPIAIFKAKNEKIEIMEDGQWRELTKNDSLESLQEFFKKYHRDHQSEIPFTGGLAGFFSYDLCHKIEKLPRSAKDDKKIDDISFGLYDGVFIFDHQTAETYIAAHGIEEPAEEIIGRLESLIKEAAPEKFGEPELSKTLRVFESNVSKDDYLESVRKIKRYIKSGDIYQANFTQRFETEYNGDPWRLYQKLREINPAPFASFFDCGDFQIVSSSPERFIKTDKRMIQTRPIKGTIARGKDKDEDTQNKRILQNSEKDKSELLMIVDLARNDLGRISKTGTVTVKELFALEEYPTVYHLVATIQGELLDEVSETDIIRAAFPGGSITGTPKIRAMEIIDELEPTQRNIYTGSIGYIDLNGNMDLNIAIRTIITKNKKAFFQVGGAIVWDSEEESEYEETILKGRALRKALEES